MDPLGIGRFACQEGVAVDLAGSGVGVSSDAADGVDGFADGDAGEADLGQHRLPARTGQPAGYLTGPEVDVPSRSFRHPESVGDCGERPPAARPQPSADPGEDGVLVRSEVDDDVGDGDVGPGVLHRERRGQDGAEHDVVHVIALRPRSGKGLVASQPSKGSKPCSDAQPGASAAGPSDTTPAHTRRRRWVEPPLVVIVAAGDTAQLRPVGQAPGGPKRDVPVGA